MALFTKLFERDRNPYDLKGRWYKIHVTSTGSSLSIDFNNSDLKQNEVTPNGTSGLRIKSAGRHIIQYVLDVGYISGSGASFTPQFYIAATEVEIKLPNANRYSSLNAYVYIAKME